MNQKQIKFFAMIVVPIVLITVGISVFFNFSSAIYLPITVFLVTFFLC